MKIMIVGATGTIGKAVATLLEQDHDIVRVGHHDGDHRVDLGSKASIEELFDAVGQVDAVISTAGQASFAPFAELDDGAFDLAIRNKLMGQVNLVRVGNDRVNDGGSITLTSGILARLPMPGSVAVSMANGALDAFAGAAAMEIGRGIRVNVVSPAFVKETMAMMGMDPTPGVSAADTAKAYKLAVESDVNGEVLDVTG
jgi:NAD(P)-dependent dehydrogenase (short-subunit alcohol dehydrogenase family)